MTTSKKTLLLGLFAIAVGCGGTQTVPVPDLDDFEIDDDTQDELDEAGETGDGAQGTYSYDDTTGVLSIDITNTTFACGIDTGLFAANVGTLSATTMVWSFADDPDAEVTWTRVDDAGSAISIVGVWHTDDPDIYAVFEPDGTATLLGDAPCNDGDRNEYNCVEMGLFGADITLDGDLSDWSTVGGSATLYDDWGDHTGDDDGADITAVKVEVMQGSLLVMVDLAGGPSENFQEGQGPYSASYRLHIGSGNQTLYARIVFDSIARQWNIVDSDDVTIAAGAEGFELAVDLGLFSSDTIDIIRFEARDCGAGQCEVLDEIDTCGFVDLP